MGNSTPKNRRVTLTVKAKDLFTESNYPPTEGQMDDCTALSDDEGYASDYGNANKDYETLVYMNYQMGWDIDASDKNGVDRGYTVALASVSHNPVAGNPQFFTSNPLNVGTNKKVTGTIANNPNLANNPPS